MRCTFWRVTPSRRASCGTVRAAPDAALSTCQRACVWPSPRANPSPLPPERARELVEIGDDERDEPRLRGRRHGNHGAIMTIYCQMGFGAPFAS